MLEWFDTQLYELEAVSQDLDKRFSFKKGSSKEKTLIQRLKFLEKQELNFPVVI